MVNIKAPEGYINEAGSIRTAGERISLYGKNALLIAGHTAFEVAGEALVQSLNENGIQFRHEEFTGYPTIEKAQEYAQIAIDEHKDVIIAVGGGKTCDVSKVAADIAGLPVVTIPTIVATCAAWAAVSVVYTAEGDFSTFHANRFTPRLIIADPEILVKAPERYLKAGIVDTYAKWYELAPGLKGRADSLPMQLSSYGAKLAFDILDDSWQGAVEATRRQEINKEFLDTVDAIVFLAGYVGTFVGARAYSGFAHPFYHSSRRIPGSRKSLHGELVAYGILAQLVLEQKPETEIAETIHKFDAFDEAFTLEDLGLDENYETGLRVVAQRILDEFGACRKLFAQLGIDLNVENIYESLIKADELVRKYR